MKGSEFVAAYASRGYGAWETAAVDAAKAGSLVTWPLVPVTLVRGADSLTIQVASDYFAIGTLEDFVRLPLTPSKAQEVADIWGMLLPTCAMVKAIHEQAQVKVPPIRSGELSPPAQNLGANLAQYAAHSAAVDLQLRKLGFPMGLTSGTKKDIVIGNLWKPGKVLIYGWCKGDVPPGPDPAPTMGDPVHNLPPWRIQMYSNVHGDFYVDYSHGVRLISPKATLNGQPVELAAVLRDPKLAPVASWEGALRETRYPTPGKPLPVASAWVPTTPGLASLGTQRVLQEALHPDRSVDD